jgi:hypothetical protein
MKILIIGGGWYGCHLSKFLLENNINFTIVDKANKLFTGSSFKNQNRLHLGFHYPRSDNTIIECQKGFLKFINKYNHLCNPINNNFYFISSQNSYINNHEYMKKMIECNNSFVEYDKKLPIDILNVELPVIKVNEQYINPFKSQQYFSELLSSHLKHINSFQNINDILSQLNDHYDIVVNCTYNQLNPINFDHYELYVTLLYKINVSETFAYTIMDGPFFSIYPYDIENNIYTLTSVIHGIAYKGNVPQYSLTTEELNNIISKMNAQILEYIPSWNNIATYYSYYTSWKTKFDTINDDRSLQYSFDGKILNFYGGKITGIFEAENILKSILKI